MSDKLYIQAFWDKDAEVWVATSKDIPGLATEARTQEELATKLQNIVPELLELNHVKYKSVHLISEQDIQVEVADVA